MWDSRWVGGFRSISVFTEVHVSVDPASDHSMFEEPTGWHWLEFTSLQSGD